MRPDVGETPVRFSLWGTLIEAIKLGSSLQGLHRNIFRFEEVKLAQLLDIIRAVASGYAINAVADKRSDGACGRCNCGNIQGAGY